MSLIKRFLSLFYPKTVSSVVIPEMSDIERGARNIPPPKPVTSLPHKSVFPKECDGECNCGRSHMKSEYGCTKTFLKSPTAKSISTPMKIREGSSKPKRDDIGMSGYKSRRDYDDDIDNTAMVALTTALISEPSSSSYTPSESYSPSSSDSYSSSSSSSDSSSSYDSSSSSSSDSGGGW
jgi:hypothetical protein